MSVNYLIDCIDIIFINSNFKIKLTIKIRFDYYAKKIAILFKRNSSTEPSRSPRFAVSPMSELLANDKTPSERTLSSQSSPPQINDNLSALSPLRPSSACSSPENKSSGHKFSAGHTTKDIIEAALNSVRSRDNLPPTTPKYLPFLSFNNWLLTVRSSGESIGELSEKKTQSESEAK